MARLTVAMPFTQRAGPRNPPIAAGMAGYGAPQITKRVGRAASGAPNPPYDALTSASREFDSLSDRCSTELFFRVHGAAPPSVTRYWTRAQGGSAVLVRPISPKNRRIRDQLEPKSEATTPSGSLALRDQRTRGAGMGNRC